jgi:hypothetical protein
MLPKIHIMARQKSSFQSHQRSVLRLEHLEDRSVPAFFTVTSIADTTGLTAASGNGTQIDPFLIGSLRSAIEQSNALSGADTITFDATAFATAKTITLGGTQLTITDDVTITGPTARVTVNANNASRVFQVSDGTASLKTVTISGLTINGGSIGGSGGGIFNQENLTIQNSTISGNSANYGGGVHSYRAARIQNSMISGNSAKYGGGVFNTYGTATIQNSTISGNSATYGGGITNLGKATIQNSTLSGNSASGRGGGVYIYGSGTATIQNSTISGNTATQGGGVYNNNGTATIQNSIISGNLSSINGREIRLGSGTIIANANNLFGSSASSNTQAFSGFTHGASDITATSDGSRSTALSAILGTLQNNGGPTQTMALVAGSPAINAGSSANGLTTDQRGTGFARVQIGRVDIGAFEFQNPTTNPLVVDTISDDLDGDLTVGNFSLREAITIANDRAGADTITFDATAFATAKTITLGGTELAITDDLTITGPTARVTINANNLSRVFNVDDGTAAVKTVIIDGLTISGGSTSVNGGGVLNFENLTIRNSTLSGNTANSGGGLHNNSGTATIQNSTISGNSANFGGGVYTSTGTATIQNSTLSGNTSTQGGGVFNDIGTATIQNSIISGNSANFGGGVINATGTATIQNSTVSRNTSTQGGGVFTTGTATIQNSTISGNSASNFGGGVINASGTATIQNSIISGNSATTDGGEVFNAGVTITANANNLFGSSSLTNAQAFSSFTPGASDITATSDGTSPTALASILSPLANNGGPTQTHALVAGSPAINAGDGTVLGGLITDQRGATRVQGSAVDIGAYEAILVNLSVSTSTGSEAGATVITVTATASSAVFGNQTLMINVAGAGVTSGDYVLSSTMITILAGQTTGSVTFTIVDDATVENPETAFLLLSSPSAGILLGDSTNRVVTITDNDVAPSVAAVNPVSVSLTSSTPDRTNLTSIPVVATFSANVVGFTADKIRVTNGVVRNFTGSGGIYTFDVIPTLEGLVAVSIDPGAATDLAGNATLASNSFQTTFFVDPLTIAATTTPAGNLITIRNTDGTPRFNFNPFPGSQQPISLASADINHDGTADLIVGAAGLGGPHVKIYDGKTGAEVFSFFAFDPLFTGGVNVSTSDVDGDGFADIIVGAGPGAAPHVKVFSGKDLSILQSFFAFDLNFAGDATVASADVNGDGFADIIVMPKNGAPHVKVFDGRTLQELSSFFAPSVGLPGTDNQLVAGDTNGDRQAEIFVTAGPIVSKLNGRNGSLEKFIAPYGPTFLGGIRLDGKPDNLGFFDLVTTSNSGGAFEHREVFDGDTLTVLESFFVAK